MISVSARMVCLLKALREGVLSIATKKQHADLEGVSDIVLQLAAANLKSIARKLDPKTPIIVGAYTENGLRLVDRTSIVFERRQTLAAHEAG